MDKLYSLCEEVGGHFDGCELHCVSYCNDGMGREREREEGREEEGRERCIKALLTLLLFFFL